MLYVSLSYCILYICDSFSSDFEVTFFFGGGGYCDAYAAICLMFNFLDEMLR